MNFPEHRENTVQDMRWCDKNRKTVMACNGWVRPWLSFCTVLAQLALLATALRPEAALGQTRPVPLEIPTTQASAVDNPLRAQEAVAELTNPEDPMAVLSVELQARAAQLQSDTEHSAEVKELLSKSYQQAQADLKLATLSRQKALEWSNRASAAPALLEAARRKKESLQNGVQPNGNSELSGLSYDEAQVHLQGLQANLATATAERTKFADDVIAREKRRKELPQLISDAQSKIEQHKNLQANASSPEDPIVAEALAWSATASGFALEAQHQALEAEQRGYEAEALLLPLQLEIATALEKRLAEQVRYASDDLSARRKNRITAFAIEFEKYAGVSDAPFDRVRAWLKSTRAEETDDEKLRLTWPRLAEKQAEIKVETELALGELSSWKEQRAQMQGRVESKSSFNSWVGLILREQRDKLPDPNQQAARIRYYQREIQSADLLLFDLDEASLELKTQQEAHSSQADPTWSAMMQSSEEIIAAMTVDAKAYQNGLYAIADIREQTRQRTFEYRDFIDKHVLWIRSCDPLHQTDFKKALEAVRWLCDAGNWRQLGSMAKQDALSRPWWYLLLVVGMGVMISNHSRLRMRLSELSLRAEKSSCTDFSLTSRALSLSTLIALPMPLVLLFAAWRLNAAYDLLLPMPAEAGFVGAIARGCWLTAAVVIPLELLRCMCRPNGLGIKHFGWNSNIASLLRSRLRRLIQYSIPLILLIGVLISQSNARWESSLGRVIFMLLMPLLTLFFARAFLPSKGVLSGFLAKNQGGWLDRLWFLWYPTLCLLPIVLVVASGVGYFYTSQRVAAHIISMLWMAVGLAILYCTLKRWLVLSRRKLVIAQARNRLEQAAARLPGAAVPTKPVDEAEVNLVAINEQTMRLVTALIGAAGFVMAYFIWRDVMPAISLLNEIPLWTVKGDIPEKDVIISLANLVLVVPIVAIVVIASRNVPGLLEIAFLQHLPLTTAARYAITTLARYVIIGIGIVVVSSTIGLQWSSIHWLVAALGVGLGFGLQEIFANFVSGIILLFEQPIRVGDIITIDGVTGSVSRIRMRATTIQNWDRQELVVPNKDLITGKLLNWTLSDTTNRITLNIGVAYGSDVKTACELIHQVCEDCTEVMSTPAPSVTFETFGDNSLNLVLRAFLASLNNRLATIHALHSEIYAAFRRAGIEIAFPQRDLHLRTIPESLSKWMQARSADAKDTH